ATRIGWAREYGIYLILAMNYSYQVSGRGIPIWSGPGQIPDRQNFLIQLWQEMARRYQGESTIAGYDLLNEPRPPRDTDWQSLAQRLTASIRTVDRNHIIFVSNSLTETSVSASSWQIRPFLIGDRNVVYTGHSYEPVALTHQGLPWVANSDGTSWAPPGAHYPATVVESGTYVGGYYGAPGNVRPTDWTQVQTPWAALPATASVGRVSLQSVNDSGRVWIDDVSLEQLAPDGTIRTITINNGDFTLPTPYTQYSPLPGYRDFNFLAFSSYPPFWQLADTGVREGHPQLINYRNAATANVAWDQTIGHNTLGSIRFNQCRHCAAVTNFTTNSFVVRPGYQYRISYWIRAEGTGGDGAWNFAAFDATDGRFVEWNRDYLRQRLSFFHNWSSANNVPFFLGEFGVVGNFPDHDDLRWVTDMLAIVREFGFHWSYFNWRGPHSVNLDFPLVLGTSSNPFAEERGELLEILSRAARAGR
ncbi:cellulase family glycosylhydrolase, partial [Candidatus Saganbacteria bacterium]|nr:cellulase family glycosylhydrolase [Candidatus Saganbacteria bacterium]